MTPKKRKRVFAYLLKQGMKINVCTQKELDELLENRSVRLDRAPFLSLPFRSFIDWQGKVLYITEAASKNAMVLIHEAGHILASKKTPGNSEEDHFLAWEMLVAKKLGVFTEWAKKQSDYGIWHDGYDTLGDILKADKKTLAAFMEEILDIGCKEGNITADGKPQSIR